MKINQIPTFLLSPCASNPIKQRVEAFEKLQTPQKETRNKTRLINAESEVGFASRSMSTCKTDHYFIIFVHRKQQNQILRFKRQCPAMIYSINTHARIQQHVKALKRQR